MEKIFTHPDLAWTTFLYEMLLSENVACTLKNGGLSGGVGDLPAHEVWPEIWLTDLSNKQHARSLLAAHEVKTEEENSWTCAQCGEVIESQFTACWQCGHSSQLEN